MVGFIPGSAFLELGINARDLIGALFDGDGEAALEAGLGAALSVVEAFPILGSAAKRGLHSVARGLGLIKSAKDRALELLRVPVSNEKVGILWGGGIVQQGRPWERYLERDKRLGDVLPFSFKTFDRYNPETGLANSLKTLDTNAPSYLVNPHNIYRRLKRYIDQMTAFENDRVGIDRIRLSKITTMQLLLAVPAATNPAQWLQLKRAIGYAKMVNAKIVITVIR